MLQELIRALAVVVLWSTLIGAGPGEERHDLVTGILEELDLKNAKGRLRTDLGKPIFFEIVKPELLKGVRIGERVTIQLDDEGRAVKIIEVAAPELPPS